MVNAFLISCANENNNRAFADGLKIVTNIEGGNVYNVRRLSKNHFKIEMKPDAPSIYKYPDHHSYWFYFKIEGVKGKEIRIDITNCDWMKSHWKNYKPVYSYIEDPDRLTNVIWHRIEKTKLKGKTFTFIQRFNTDHVWLALRYPYNYTREKRYIKRIQKKEHVDIEELGKTAMGNPLYMIVVTDKRVPENKKMGVLIYAREHGAEQDGSWIAEGMIDFLLSQKPLADILRKKVIFLIIPIISPDSAILGRTVDPTTGTFPGEELRRRKMNSIEARLLYNRIKRFLKEGNTLDISISLHNPHGTEPNLYPHYLTVNDGARLEIAKRLHKAILKNSEGYTTWKEFTPNLGAYSVGRFAKDFGSTSILYEVNHQAANNYLSLEKLKEMGEVFLKGTADFYGFK